MVSKTLPSVVSITAYKDLSNAASMTGPNIEYLFPELKGGAPVQGRQAVGGGSGFVVRADGMIVTNAHVVQDELATYSVALADGSEHAAKVIGRDPILDIAVIQIDAVNVPVVTLGNSNNLFVGQTVLAIGNSLATFQNTVTKGIISGLGRQVAVSDDFGANQEILETAIQTDAAINPGNSGGPLLNLAGEVVGVNTAVSQRGQLIGFALPMNSVERIIENAIKNGRIIHPWIGIRYHAVDKVAREKYKITEENAAQITSDAMKKEPAVVVGSPAAKAGIKEGDVVLSVNSQPLVAHHTLALEIAKYSVGDTIQLSVLRDGKTVKFSVMLEEFPKQ